MTLPFTRILTRGGAWFVRGQIFWGLLCLLSIGGSQMVEAAAPAVRAKEAIEKMNREFVAAHFKGDAAAIARQYTKDAQALWGPDGVVTGRDAIEKLWKSEVGAGGRKVELQTLEVQETGDWAYETGHFKAYAVDGHIINDSHYLVIWKKEAGIWKMHRDLGGENRLLKKP